MSSFWRKAWAFLLVLGLLAPSYPVLAADLPLRVYYAGPSSGLPALRLITSLQLVTDPAAADVYFLNGVLPADPGLVQERLQAGAGLVWVLGPRLMGAQVASLLGEPVSLVTASQALSLVPAGGIQDALLSEIIWNSAPQVRERFALQGGGLAPLVSGFEDGSLVLGQKQIGLGRAFVLTPFLDGTNSQLQEWAYYNYLVYALVERAAGRLPLSFAAYPASPVPHRSDQFVLSAILLVLLALSGLVFWRVRRYSLAHPEALDAIVTDTRTFATREAATNWEEIGFHRPLGGFFMALFLGFILFVPLIIYQNVILPVYILPSAQALGIWGRVTQFFQLAWTFFDMGTSVAFIKYFSEYRIHDPRQGVKYGQVFVWWQVLSGAAQVVLVVALAGTVLPRTAYALYAWSIIIHSLIQIPGFYQVMRHALTGLQRFDYAQILDLGLALVFPMLTQPVFVLIMVAWGRAHPVFGVSMGGLVGLGLAAYAAEGLTFVLGLWLYRRLGFNARLYFLAHFDWDIVKKAFRFGVFEMLGSAVWGIGQSVEILITQTRLVNYAEIWGNWVLAQNFVYGYNVIATLYNDTMPSISEAISHGRKVLAQYYAATAYKWGGMISAMLAAILLSVADRFILGASGPEFVRAAGYAVPLLLWGAVQYPSWVGDNIQRGANRPWLMAVMVGIEQVTRVTLALLLVQRFQINALIFAYFVGIMVKNVLSYFVNNRMCFKQRFYVWQSLVAPLLAGIVHYIILRWITGYLWHNDQLSSILIFFIAILPSFPIFTFFYGLFGGWDDATLAEVRLGASLSSFMRPLAWTFWASSRLGARLSPLHGRFPLTVRAEAMLEAASLEKERVSLV